MMFVAGVTSGAGTANPSEAPEFNPGFSGVRVSQSVVFCVIFCRAVFVIFLLVIFYILSVFNLITTSVEPVHSEVYSIQHSVINLSMTCNRSSVFPVYAGFLYQKKTDRYDIPEILLKVVLNTITQTKPVYPFGIFKLLFSLTDIIDTIV